MEKWEWNKKGEYKMAKYIIDEDSFGSNCPKNWEEIADFLNEIIESRADGDYDVDDMNALSDEVWEQYCNGELKDAPEEIME